MSDKIRFDPQRTLRITKLGGETVRMKIRETPAPSVEQAGLSWGRLLQTLHAPQTPQPSMFGFEVTPPIPMDRPSA
jgi:hypothetical protein